MFCFPLTPWTTIRGASGTTITQGESQWLDLFGFEDIVTWLQCNEVTTGGAANVTLAYQTAPTKDELLFTPAASVSLAAATGPVITKVIMSTTANAPLARWLRWQLSASGSTSTFDATFRIWIAANIGPHALKPRTPSPALRPNGKSCSGDCQKGGSTPVAGYTPPSRDVPPGGNTSLNRRLLPGLGRRPPEHIVRGTGTGPVAGLPTRPQTSATLNPVQAQRVPPPWGNPN